MRGRGLALMAGVAVGRHAASQQAAAQQQQQQQAQAQPMQAAPAAPAAPAAAPPKDVTAELQKLADLHKSGVLTDEEFTAAKKNSLVNNSKTFFFLPVHHLSGMAREIEVLSFFGIDEPYC